MCPTSRWTMALYDFIVDVTDGDSVNVRRIGMTNPPVQLGVGKNFL